MCGKEFKQWKTRVRDGRGVFCSKECQHEWRSKNIRGKAHPSWNGGVNPYNPEFNEKLKEKIRRRDSYTCQLCGKHQDSLRVKLHVHHMDYNPQNCRLDNLIALCNRCHSGTNLNHRWWIDYFLEV